MARDEIINEYFDWLYDLVRGNKGSKRISFERLLMHLHSVEFRYSIPMDQNRAMDGIDLRWRFVCERHYDVEILDYLDGPCSVLEMMVALALYCEEHLMDDPTIGNRTGQWFWGMIVSLGLGFMTDDRYEKVYVNDVIQRLLDREYEPDGRGGLFTVRNCDCDLRNVEICHQLNRYINSII